ncbi:conjugal transfer protein TraH [Vibrio maritimus]|uniref:conjugal transfer protein TraH n=1 Tax=Vibrio maritimus TaxID=990268 RepID=UPI004068E0E6
MKLSLLILFCSLSVWSLHTSATPLADLFDAYEVSHGVTSVETQQRRGVVFGSYNMRFKTSTQNLMRFQPPSLAAGCNGIDIQMGAFSMIRDLGGQLQNSMRQIAAGTGSYAFMLAVDSLCAQCSSLMQALKEKLDEWNKFFKDSCQSGQAMARWANDNFGISEKIRNNTWMSAVNEGVSDTGEWFSSLPGKSLATILDDIEPSGSFDPGSSEYFGNIIYVSMDLANVSTIQTSHGWKYEEIMQSLVGAKIFEFSDSSELGSKSISSRFTLKDLAFGREKDFSYIKCVNPSDSKCFEISEQPMPNWVSLAMHVCQIITGAQDDNCEQPSANNLLSAIRTGGRSPGNQITSAQQSLFISSPFNVYEVFRHLALRGYDIKQVNGMVAYLSDEIAYRFAQHLGDELRRDLMATHFTIKNSHPTQADFIKEAISDIDKQMDSLTSEISTRRESDSAKAARELIRKWSIEMPWIL